LSAAGAASLGAIASRAEAGQDHPKVPGVAAEATAGAQAKPAGGEAKPRIARGGVSAQAHTPSIQGAEALIQPHPGPSSSAFPNFLYHGGPVVNCAQVYTSFWGSPWTANPARLLLASRLSQFHQDLVQSKFMNVLGQYGVNGGLFFRATFIENVPTTLTDASIHGIIQTAIDSGIFPEPTDPRNTITLMIYLDPSIGVNDPGQGLVLCEKQGSDAFGYHNFFTTKAGHAFYYAVMPGLDDACIKESCPNDNTCSLHLTETQEQRLTQVASHEFAEMTSDPQLNAWFDPINGENGDICNGEAATITVGSNKWNVQRIYSKADDMHSNGSSFCISEAPAKIPPLSPGPGAATSVSFVEDRTGHPLLPLPPVRFDLKAKQATIDDKDVNAFIKNAFGPMHHSQVIPNLGQTLRQMADVIDRLR
jgi:hypothetical protein